MSARDALNLRYDKPVDRIAARLLWKDPNFKALPEKTRSDLVMEPPRIKPEDITFIFDKPPRTNEKQQAVDHRGEMMGIYLVVGYAGSRDQYEQHRMTLHGGRKTRCGKNKSGLAQSFFYCGHVPKNGRIHYWWVRGPDGTVECVKWQVLRRLLPGETLAQASRRRYLAKHDALGRDS